MEAERGDKEETDQESRALGKPDTDRLPFKMEKKQQLGKGQSMRWG